MTSLPGRRVVLGVCGSVAAYKAVEVCRRLVEQGAHVVPVMTTGATRFIGEATLSALASERARTPSSPGPEPVPHVTLARTADVVCVAPATARLLAAYASGLADDLLVDVLLATRAPVVIAPAMHSEMWEHPATQANAVLLAERGVRLVGPVSGRLAGGDEGSGRLAEPAEIVDAVAGALGPGELEGRHVLVTAGGTREPIDPVRFLGNRSSGRQGRVLAAEAARRGAGVTLVTTVPGPPLGGVEVVRVETAAEMEKAVLARASSADVVVLAAAVADFRPKEVADSKLRRDHGPPDLVLEPTPDIAAEVGRRRRPGQVLVGFAVETADLPRRAREKLVAKGLDLVVANPVSAFDAEHNQALIVSADGSTQQTPLVTKERLAATVLDVVAEHLAKSRGGEQ